MQRIKIIIQKLRTSTRKDEYCQSPYKKRRKEKRCHRVISNLSYDSCHGSYVEINSMDLICGGKQRHGESMSGLLIQEI